MSKQTQTTDQITDPKALTIAFVSKAKRTVCNYCLEQVDSLPDDFGCSDCIRKYK